MKKFTNWHMEKMFWLMEKLDIGVYQLAWISFFKGIILGIILMCFVGCTTTKQIPAKDQCCTIKSK